MTGLRVSRSLSPRFAAIREHKLVGRRIDGFDRYGKVLILRLSGDIALGIHLGMSGRLVLRPFGQPHDHFSLEFGVGTYLTYNDFRRFGQITASSGAPSQQFGRFGPDALSREFRASVLAVQTRRPIKAVLMNQKIVAGLGNIYSSEALFMAGINPLRAANCLTASERSILVRAIKSTLRAAIKDGGSTLEDYRGTEGELGNFEKHFCVYGRAGESCVKCDSQSQITKITIEQRVTYLCKRCQR